ncbi:MAG TPA: OmpA family protein [Thermoanaerobaculia bacterium]|nr:OmpA family protein [Thermoanaerobaculia bacterium]
MLRHLRCAVAAVLLASLAGCSGRTRVPAAPPPSELEPRTVEAPALEPEEPPLATTSMAAAAAVHSEADVETPPLPPPLPEPEADATTDPSEPADTAAAQPPSAPEPRRRVRADGELPLLVYEEVYTIDDLSFDPGSAGLDDSDRSLLDQLVARLRLEDAGYLIELHGHTDATGREVHNLELGDRRAHAVRDYLHREGGLPLHRLSTISHADAKPRDDNRTAEGRARNRRVTIVVLRPSLFAPAPPG